MGRSVAMIVDTTTIVRSPYVDVSTAFAVHSKIYVGLFLHKLPSCIYHKIVIVASGSRAYSLKNSVSEHDYVRPDFAQGRLKRRVLVSIVCEKK